MMLRLVFLLLVSTLGAQQLNFKGLVSSANPLTLGDLTEYQEGLEPFLSQTISLDQSQVWVLRPRWVLHQVRLPSQLTLLGNRILVVPNGLNLNRRVLEAVADWLVQEVADPDLVFELQDLRLLEGANQFSNDPLFVSRVSGEKTFNIPNGYWVWRLSQGAQSARVRALVRPYLAALRSTRTLARGTLLAPDSFRVEFLSINQFFRKPLTTNDLNGQWSLAQAVRAGDILYAHQIQPRFDIDPQNTVRVVVQRAGLRVELNGVSQDGGNIGDRIRVRLLEGGRVLRGVVVSEGEVYVESL